MFSGGEPRRSRRISQLARRRACGVRCGRLDVWGVCGEWRPTERGDAVSSGDKRRRSAVTHTTPAAGRSRSPTRGNRNEWVDGERELR